MRLLSIPIFLSVTLALAVCGPADAQDAKKVLDTSVVADASGVKPGDTIHVAVKVNVHEGWHMNAHIPLEKFLIPTVLTLESPDGIEVGGIAYPKAENKKLGFSDSPVAVYEGTIYIGAEVKVAAAAAPGVKTLKAVLRYQACNDKQCLAPAKVPIEIPIPVVAASETIAPQNQDIFAKIDFAAVDKSATAAPSSPQKSAAPATPPQAETAADWKALLDHFTIAAQTGGYLKSDEFIRFIDGAESGKGYSAGGTFAGKSALAIVLLTLLGGLALNLTPCVLPLIPITLGIIGAGAKAGSRSRGFALGGLYGLGIALLYGALGLVAVFGVASFGAINASPWFNFAIAAIFLVLGLAMFDLILIDFTKYQSKLGIKKDRGSLAFAFIMGMVNALLAGACVAPVVFAVILYAQDTYSNGSHLGLALPFLLGIGMALPWPFAGAGLSLLPKPGKWMERIKQAFGIFMIVFAVYYAYVGYKLVAGPTAGAEAGWVSSLDEGLAQAQRENKPVLIDFWATWCKNCLWMNETTFKNKDVVSRLDKYVKVKYQAEAPDESPAKDVLSHFQYVGLPHYAILKPKPS